MSDFPKSKKELLMRLQQPRQTKDISASDYKQYVRYSTFKCPKPRQIIARCNGNTCPTRPYPCDSCSHNKKWMKVFNSKRQTYLEKGDEAYEKLLKECDKCNLLPKWYETNDYYDECIRSRNARNILDNVNSDKIIVKASGWRTQW